MRWKENYDPVNYEANILMEHVICYCVYFVFKMFWVGVFLKSREIKRVNIVVCVTTRVLNGWCEGVYSGSDIDAKTLIVWWLCVCEFVSQVWSTCVCVSEPLRACDGELVCGDDVNDVWCKFPWWHAISYFTKGIGLFNAWKSCPECHRKNQLWANQNI